jgi:hypothetical protein
MKALLILLCFVPICFADEHESSRALRARQETPGFLEAGLTKEYAFDLNGDGRLESFLLALGHSYWGEYAIYTHRQGKWMFLGYVRLGGHVPTVFRASRDGWHNFSIDTDGSRNRLVRTYYRWDSAEATYTEHAQKKLDRCFPNDRNAYHALQRTAPCVTAPASAAAFPPAMQVPRRTPRSLSLGSLGAC